MNGTLWIKKARKELSNEKNVFTFDSIAGKS